jgi:CDGSH-type Zn-finger protein/uncharacterized Fe-S cluster protein YjdI
MSADGVKAYKGGHLTVYFDGAKCIHSRNCLTGAPAAFDTRERPWVRPDAAGAEAVAQVVRQCPSGALRYVRNDGGPGETAPPVNLITLREAGPYAVRAEIVIDGQPAHYRATLCRCGASKNKPFCDNSHLAIGFSASGEAPPSGAPGRLETRDGPLAIDPEANGPLQVRGNVEINCGSGRVIARMREATLCRCGGSATKPFCDDTHLRIGFKTG